MRLSTQETVIRSFLNLETNAQAHYNTYQIRPPSKCAGGIGFRRILNHSAQDESALRTGKTSLATEQMTLFDLAGAFIFTWTRFH